MMFYIKITKTIAFLDWSNIHVFDMQLMLHGYSVQREKPVPFAPAAEIDDGYGKLGLTVFVLNFYN